MTYSKSVFDSITAALAGTIRIISDINVNVLMGTKVTVLRIYKEKRDIFGEEEEYYDSHTVGNCVINYPFDKVELFGKQNSEGKQESNVIEISDLMPIEMEISFEGDKEDDPVELAAGDLLVDVFVDHLGTKIPLILEIENYYGAFFGKFLVSRTYELSLIRYPIGDEIQALIDKYVASVTF